MDLMLTSFGDSHLPRRSRRNTDIFYRMPPAALSTAGIEFMPDYAALLLADRVVADTQRRRAKPRGRVTSKPIVSH